ncbi:MAG: hypothetical protein FWE25_01700 [Lachnospiraceae bacterium]|nr:hypothetical protein [Lachnospiraceae bacterium]
MAGMQEFKCPSCGGAIEFDSSIQKMKCPYCDAEFDMAAIQSIEREIQQEEAQGEAHWDMEAGGDWAEGEADGMAIYSCHSCGGEIVGDATMAATNCPYCDNPVVLTGNLSGDLRPDYVIPFKLDKQAAKEGLLKHFKGKRLLPKIFKNENHVDEVRGLYVPFWLFDADVKGQIHYRGTKVRRWSDSRFDYTETSHFDILRGGQVAFDKVPVDGSAKMPDELMESIEPYNYEDKVAFQTAYLAGFLADRYDVTADESLPRAKVRVKSSTEQAFGDTVRGYATVVPKSTNLTLNQGTVRYALLPVWILNTTWRNKKYLFAMNGQTGKFVGDLPMDWGAFWRYWAIFMGIFSIVGFAIVWFIL